MRDYNPADPLSIFAYSGKLIKHTLSEILPEIDSSTQLEDIERDGKGGLGILVEKHFFGYEPNSDPRPDFPDAGVELKVSPLKFGRNEELLIKERLVCDMIDYFALVEESFDTSRFFKKSKLMLILFYLHLKGWERKDLRFLYSVLWMLKEKDLLIIKEDFRVIQEKVRKGLAHEISEGDTMYLGACRKGQKGQSPRKQPNNDIPAPARAFSLKPAYMRSILDFVRRTGESMASNLTSDEMPGIELVTTSQLQTDTFEGLLRKRFEPFIGKDYKEISSILGWDIKASDKGKYSRIARGIIADNLIHEDNAEEFRKAGIKIKTIRIQKNGTVKEHMSFEQINYREVAETEHWIDSKWYEIVTTRYLFVIFREVEDPEWGSEKRFILDRMFFWTMPASDYPVAEKFWENIKANVAADTLLDCGNCVNTNTFWRLADHKYFHVRPKARDSKDTTTSPVSGMIVPKKAIGLKKVILPKKSKTLTETTGITYLKKTTKKHEPLPDTRKRTAMRLWCMRPHSRVLSSLKTIDGKSFRRFGVIRFLKPGGYTCR